jgi:nucleoid DNA-binding protein
MTKPSTSDALKALATGTTARSETAKLRDLFDDIENALKAGVRRAAILETLKKDGINLTIKGFDSAITRIRKERKGKTPKENVQETSQTQPNNDSQKPLSRESKTTIKKQGGQQDVKEVFADLLTKPDEKKFSAIPKEYD